MNKTRLEAFSDGVIAIIITIMVLDLHAPQGGDASGLRPLIPVFFSYIMSFLYVGIYWNNHHHLLHLVEKINGAVLWANLHLLFWLSLFPFVTAWMGENHFAAGPVALYGIVLAAAATAYYILTLVLLAVPDQSTTLARALGRDLKGKISILIYAIGIVVAFFQSWLAMALYLVVAALWLIPDRRVEKVLDIQ